MTRKLRTLVAWLGAWLGARLGSRSGRGPQLLLQEPGPPSDPAPRPASPALPEPPRQDPQVVTAPARSGEDHFQSPSGVASKRLMGDSSDIRNPRTRKAVRRMISEQSEAAPAKRASARDALSRRLEAASAAGEEQVIWRAPHRMDHSRVLIQHLETLGCVHSWSKGENPCLIIRPLDVTDQSLLRTALMGAAPDVPWVTGPGRLSLNLPGRCEVMLAFEQGTGALMMGLLNGGSAPEGAPLQEKDEAMKRALQRDLVWIGSADTLRRLGRDEVASRLVSLLREALSLPDPPEPS